MKNPTIEQLVKQRTHQKSLSLPQLVSELGYTNISKGCRRLNEYLTSLHPPSDQFVVNLLCVLDINALEFSKAVSCTLDKMCADAETLFRPYIRILLGIQIRPAIAWQIVHNQCCLSVPQDLQDKPYREELDAIFFLYKDHVETELNGRLKNNIIGFEYHRKHDHYIRLNADLVLEETVFVPPILSGKQPLANRMGNLLMGRTR